MTIDAGFDSKITSAGLAAPGTSHTGSGPAPKETPLLRRRATKLLTVTLGLSALVAGGSAVSALVGRDSPSQDVACAQSLDNIAAFKSQQAALLASNAVENPLGQGKASIALKTSHSPQEISTLASAAGLELRGLTVTFLGDHEITARTTLRDGSLDATLARWSADLTLYLSKWSEAEADRAPVAAAVTAQINRGELPVVAIEATGTWAALGAFAADDDVFSVSTIDLPAYRKPSAREVQQIQEMCS